MRKIIVAALTATAITAIGGGAVATINLTQVGAPMSEEPQTIFQNQNQLLKKRKKLL